jgi:HAD superfamily hydrolase (TIGR01450 family)
VPLPAAIAGYDQFLLDLDGCLWIGDRPAEGATAAVAALRAAGKDIAFLTNSARQAPEEFVRKLWRLGFQAGVYEVVTSGAALQFVLAGRQAGGAAFVIGARPVMDHVAAAGYRVVNNTEFASRADLVVVAGHDDLHFRELRTATQAVIRGAELIGLSRDRTFPMPDGPWPGTGAVLAAVEEAGGRTADRIIGKPEPPMYAAARDRFGPGRVLAVGDRLDTDVEGARRAGLDQALVLTGATSREEAAAADPQPTHVAGSLAALVLG